MVLLALFEETNWRKCMDMRLRERYDQRDLSTLISQAGSRIPPSVRRGAIAYMITITMCYEKRPMMTAICVSHCIRRKGEFAFAPAINLASASTSSLSFPTIHHPSLSSYHPYPATLNICVNSEDTPKPLPPNRRGRLPSASTDSRHCSSRLPRAYGQSVAGGRRGVWGVAKQDG